MPEITDVTLSSTAGSIQQELDEAFDKAPDNSSKIQLLQALYLSLNRFSREWKSNIPNPELLLGNQGCPDGWESCPDGSCVPPGVGCGGGLNFDKDDNLILLSKNKNGEVEEIRQTIDEAKSFLSSYLKDAVSAYFAATPESAKQTTRDLLDKVRSDFSDATNLLAQ